MTDRPVHDGEPDGGSTTGDAQHDRLVETVSGSLVGGVRSVVLERAIEYWKSVDPDVGTRIGENVRLGAAPEPVSGMGET